MPLLPTNVTANPPNYTKEEHATHHNVLHELNNDLDPTAGSALEVLRIDAAGTALEWAAPSAGGITGQGAGSNSVLVGDSAVASADQSVALGDFVCAPLGYGGGPYGVMAYGGFEMCDVDAETPVPIRSNVRDLCIIRC